MELKCATVEGWEIIDYEPRVCVNKNEFGDFVVNFAVDGKTISNFWNIIPGMFN